MSIHSYARPTLPGGANISPRDVNSSNETLSELVKTNIPGKNFIFIMNNTNMDFDFADTLTAGEITTLDSTVSGFIPVNKTELLEWTVEEIVQGEAGRIEAIKRWATDNGDSTYADLVEETLYTYSGNVLIGETYNHYNSNGIIVESRQYDYYKNNTNQIKKRT